MKFPQLSPVQWHSRPSINVWPEVHHRRRTGQLHRTTLADNTRRPPTVGQVLAWNQNPATMGETRPVEFVSDGRHVAVTGFLVQLFILSLHSTTLRMSAWLCRYTVFWYRSPRRDLGSKSAPAQSCLPNINFLPRCRARPRLVKSQVRA